MRTLRALTVILTAVALIPGGAHIAELPNKLALVRDQYFIVQQIYRGWALSGVVIIAAFIANLALAAMLWRRGEPFWSFRRLPVSRLQHRSPCFSRGSIRQTSPQPTGPRSRPTGKSYEPDGNSGTWPARA